MTEILTPQQVKDWFHASGLSIRDWAIEHGFKPATVYKLLNERARGRRGEAHDAAVALRLKHGVPRAEGWLLIGLGDPALNAPAADADTESSY